MKNNTTKMVRLSEETLEKAKALGLNPSAIMRQALEDAVNNKICPSCGAAIKENRKPAK